MPYAVAVAPIGTSKIVCVDCLQRLDAAAARALRADGFVAAGRYVNLTEAPSPYAVTREELAEVTGEGIGMWAIQFARTHGWSEETGAADGAAAVRNALAAGFPPGSVVEMDLEGKIPLELQAPYANCWYEAATREGGGELAGYIGEGVLLSASQLFHELAFRRYHRSMSQVPNVDVRGYQMLQLFPDDQELAVLPGRRFDLDVVQGDYLGGRWTWTVAG